MNYTKLSHEEYKKLVVRTMSPNFYLGYGTNIVQKEGRLTELHCAIGMVTEVTELMEAVLKPDSQSKSINIGEECGDLFWYAANLERIIGWEIHSEPALVSPSPINVVADLVITTGSMLDIYKKTMYYDKSIDFPRLLGLLKQTYNNAETLACAFGHDTAVIKAKNINKLWVRFPEKFSEVNAQVRNLDAEYEKLK